MVETILSIADSILFLCISLSGIYYFIFASATTFRKTEKYPKAKQKHRYALLLPTGTSIPVLNYPEELYDIHFYEQLHETVQALDDTKYDMAVILGRDSQISATLLQEINNAYDAGTRAIQLHHVIENRSTRKLRRQAINEEINHAVFKQGHTLLGLSSAMDGMDIAVELKWLQKNLKSTKSNLERRLMRQQVFTDYLVDSVVSSPTARTRTHEIRGKKVLSDLPEALLQGNWEYADKLLRRLLPSWKALLITTSTLAIAMSCYNGGLSIKWWVLLFCLLLTVSLAIPDYLVETKKKRKSKKD